MLGPSSTTRIKRSMLSEEYHYRNRFACLGRWQDCQPSHNITVAVETHHADKMQHKFESLHLVAAKIPSSYFCRRSLCHDYLLPLSSTPTLDVVPLHITANRRLKACLRWNPPANLHRRHPILRLQVQELYQLCPHHRGGPRRLFGGVSEDGYDPRACTTIPTTGVRQHRAWLSGRRTNIKALNQTRCKAING